MNTGLEPRGNKMLKQKIFNIMNAIVKVKTFEDDKFVLKMTTLINMNQNLECYDSNEREEVQNFFVSFNSYAHAVVHFTSVKKVSILKDRIEANIKVVQDAHSCLCNMFETYCQCFGGQYNMDDVQEFLVAVM